MRRNPDPEFSPYPGEPALDAAWRLALETFGSEMPTPSVVPGLDGSVQFIWHKAGWDVELDVDALQAFVWARNRTTGETWDGPLYDTWDRFSNVLAMLATG